MGSAIRSKARRVLLRAGLGLLALVALVLLALPDWRRWLPVETARGPMLLLQPAAPVGEARAVVEAWQAALNEEGLQAQVVDVGRIDRDGVPGRPSGLLLPDSAIVELSDAAVAAIERYVREGGRLLLSYDAGTRRAEDGSYSTLRSRLSGLAGVGYAHYSQRREDMFRRGTVLLTDAGMQALAVQPGKTVATPQGRELKTYGYSHLLYPQFATSGPVDGEVLARSPAGDTLIVRRHHGRGEVLFVNLPLGYLKTRSDGYLLHQSLRLFFTAMAGQAQLLPVPGGIGGMVLNMHIDSGAAVAPLQLLESRGLLAQAPLSLHITAGPDTYRSGDGAGLNLDGNAWAQAFVRRMAALGHEIGSHGGWIHNEFGVHANEDNRERFEPHLVRNHASVARVLGRAPTSYSAPMGNQPHWSSRWLAAHDIVAHYDVGGGGLGPTRAWRDGQAMRTGMWSFPVLNFGSIATFEEIDDPAHRHSATHGSDAPGIQAHRDMVLATMDYVATQRVARLTYFHAPEAAHHADVIAAWLERAATLAAAQRFTLYRMEDLAHFMTRRERSTWNWDGRTLRASQADSLTGLTWRLPGAASRKVTLESGSARWRIDGDSLLVEALAGRELRLQLH